MGRVTFCSRLDTAMAKGCRVVKPDCSAAAMPMGAGLLEVYPLVIERFRTRHAAEDTAVPLAEAMANIRRKKGGGGHRKMARG